MDVLRLASSVLHSPGFGSGAPAGLYIHVPFCASVCPYCDFAVTIAGDRRREGYVDAVLREAGTWGAAGLRFETVYLGGGTPSALEAERLQRLVAGLREAVDIDPAVRWYLEVNPEDVSATSVRLWRDLGFGTVSLGLQALDDESLTFLGRRHGAADGLRAADALLSAGFDTVSFDLIYGFAGHEAATWRRTLEEVVSLGPDHLSCYQLTVESGTVFGKRQARGSVLTVGEERQAELFLLTHRALAAAGYPAYEVSNFARTPAHRSLHNSRYWDHTPYLGLGPSAHSFDGGRRWWNERRLRHYCREVLAGRSPVAGKEELSRSELALEAVMLGLRTAAGVDLPELRDRWGVDLLGDNEALLERWSEEGLVEIDGDRVRPTLAGMAVAEGLAGALIVEPGPER